MRRHVGTRSPVAWSRLKTGGGIGEALERRLGGAIQAWAIPTSRPFPKQLGQASRSVGAQQDAVGGDVGDAKGDSLVISWRQPCCR